MRKFLALGLMITLFVSCEKDDSNSTNPNDDQTVYLPLEIGNYWVYQHFNIDSLGNETVTNRTDSVIINRDTIINNYRYFVLEGTNYPYTRSSWEIIELLRDSSGFIVNEKGNIRFSESNFTDTLYSKVELFDEDTLYSLTCHMEEIDAPVNVPAGEFNVLNYKGTVTTPRQIPGTKNPRYIDNLYANHVGKVLQSYFYLSSSVMCEKRLVRYHIVKE